MSARAWRRRRRIALRGWSEITRRRHQDRVERRRNSMLQGWTPYEGSTTLRRRSLRREAAMRTEYHRRHR